MLPSQEPLIYDLKSKDGVPSVLNCEGSWSTILHDVFPDQIDALLSDQTGHHFASYLSCVSCLRKTKPAVLDRHPVNDLLWTYGKNGGRKFTEAASKCLPELSQCLSTNMATIPEGEELDAILNLGMSALESIMAACSCGLHDGETGAPRAAEPCLQTISETIIVFLWILVDCDITRDVSPSITGLKNLFVWVGDFHFRTNNPFTNGLNGRQAIKQMNLPFYTPLFDRDYPFTGIDLVFQVLSGSTGLATQQQPPNDQPQSTMAKTLARVGNGICVYYCAVQDPTSPIETMFRFRVVRGYIAYSGCRYKELCAMKRALMQEPMARGDVAIPQIKDLINNFIDYSPRSINTIVEETNDATRLEMAYILSSSGEGNPRQQIYLHPSVIYQKIHDLLKISMYQRYCDDPQCGNTIKYPSVADSEDLYLTASISKDSYDPIQGSFQSLTWTQDVWTLMYGQDAWFIIINQPVLLYALISLFDDTSISLMPFMARLDHTNARAIRLGHVWLDIVDEVYEIDGINLKVEVEHPFTTNIIASDMSEFDLERTLLLSREPQSSS